MASSKVLLADGSDGVLSLIEKYCSLASLNGNVWALRSCGGYVDVLDPLEGDLLDTINLPEPSVLIRHAANRVWLLALSGRIIVYETSGVVLGVLDVQMGELDKMYTLDACPPFLATSKRGSYQLWDVKRMTLQREFPCEGSALVAILPIYQDASFLLSVQEDRVALWSVKSSSPMCVEALESTAVAAVLARSHHGGSYPDTCWVGGGRWISIFRVEEDPMKVPFLSKERLIPCARVQRLLSISATRLASLDAEALLTVWDSRSCVPLRLFKVDAAMGIERGCAAPFIFKIGTVRVATIWTLCGDKCLEWVDRELEEETATANTLDEAAESVVQDEIVHLRKTNMCLLEMMEVYRRKVLEIVSSPGGDMVSIAAAAVALDKCLGDQLVALGRNDNQPGSTGGISSRTEHSRYWHEKCIMERQRNALLLSDLRLATDCLNGNSSAPNLDTKIVDLLMANCASHERESELRRQVLQLEVQLHKLDRPNAATIFTLRGFADGRTNDNCINDVDDDKKRCRTYTVELQKELQCVADMGEGAVSAQRDVKRLTEALLNAENVLRLERERVLSLSQRVSLMEDENEKLLATVEYLQSELQNSKREGDELAELLKQQQEKGEEAARRASLAISEKMEEVRLLQQQLEAASESADLASEIELRDAKIAGLGRQLECIKTMLTARQEESLAVGSAYDSIVEMLQSIKRGSPMTFIVRFLEDIDTRLERLTTSERLIMAKDDQLAARDDELRILRSRVQAMETDVTKVSSLFSQFPHSVEDMERVLVELNEYRQRYGRSDDIDEVVAMHLLQMGMSRHEGD